MQIEKLRQKIDKIDRNIILQLAKRMQIVSRIAAYKKKIGMAVKQQKREDEIMSRACELAKKAGIDPKLVKRVFRMILKESCAFQKANRKRQTRA